MIGIIKSDLSTRLSTYSVFIEWMLYIHLNTEIQLIITTAIFFPQASVMNVKMCIPCFYACISNSNRMPPATGKIISVYHKYIKEISYLIV